MYWVDKVMQDYNLMQSQFILIVGRLLLRIGVYLLITWICVQQEQNSANSDLHHNILECRQHNLFANFIFYTEEQTMAKTATKEVTAESKCDPVKELARDCLCALIANADATDPQEAVRQAYEFANAFENYKNY